MKIGQKFNQPLKDVVMYKINTLNILTNVRAEQKKLFDKHGYMINFDKKGNWIDSQKNYDDLEKKIPCSLWHMFGSNCISNNGEVIKTWDIQLNNNIEDLNKILESQL